MKKSKHTETFFDISLQLSCWVRSVGRPSCRFHAPFLISCSYDLQARQSLAASSCDLVCAKLACRGEGPAAELSSVGTLGPGMLELSSRTASALPRTSSKSTMPSDSRPAPYLVRRNWQTESSLSSEVERGQSLPDRELPPQQLAVVRP